MTDCSKGKGESTIVRLTGLPRYRVRQTMRQHLFHAANGTGRRFDVSFDERAVINAKGRAFEKQSRTTTA